MRLAIKLPGKALELDIDNKLIILGGPNGVGKSTLLQDCFATYQQPSHANRFIHNGYGLYLDGKKLRIKLVVPRSLDDISLPFTYTSQAAAPPIGGLDYESFRAFFEEDGSPKLSNRLLGEISRLVTPADHQIYKDGSITDRNALYKSIFMRLLVPNLSSLNVAFLSYHREYATRRYAGASQDEIITAIGPPKWIQAQKILDKLGLPFKIVTPDIDKELPEDFSFRLVHKGNGQYVQGDRLSSGQRSALLLYDLLAGATDDEALLLDDIDGFMHPDLLQKFAAALHEMLTQKNIIALWVSHSPVLIQMSKTASYFFIESFGDYPKATTKSSLIERLSGGSLVVADTLYTVFVEGNDTSFYEGFYRGLLARKLISIRRQLRFVSPRSNRTGDDSSCDAVIDLVAVLHQHGFEKLFGGVIDLDNAHKLALPGVERLARYSKENYIFDPINVYAWCIDNKIDCLRDLPRFPDVEFGMSNVLITILSVDELQQILDYFVSRLLDDEDIQKKNPGLAPREKINIDEDKILSYPPFLLKMKGKLLKGAYARIHSKFNTFELERQFLKLSFRPPELVRLMERLAS